MVSFHVWVKKCIIKSTPNGMLFSISVYCSISAINALNGKTLINAYMGTGLQRDYVLNGMSTYIFFMSFVGDGSIVSTFFAVITTGDNASKTGKILWVGNSAENYVSLTDGVTLHLHITSSIWMQCALAKV